MRIAAGAIPVVGRFSAGVFAGLAANVLAV
jgi:hypothetical protein